MQETKYIKIGITGQSGFIGTHLYNYLGLQKDVERIPWEDSYFEDTAKLEKFVASCDAIVHLAAVNRHAEEETLYQTNVDLVEKLITAMERSNSTPHVLFSSSTQEDLNNTYGNSKKKGRELFIAWAEINKASFSGLVIPNVFGPFGNPFYNSVVATFCHLLSRNEEPQIQVDKALNLIYVSELVSTIYNLIKNKEKGKVETIPVNHTATAKVTEILELLIAFKKEYLESGIFPSLDNPFERNLFNTFVCYMDLENYFPFNLTKHSDDRGSFVETVKLNSGGQVSFSTTKPGITRGNHFHTRKAERFAVIKGKARIQLRRIGTDEVINFYLNDESPSYVDMPVWYTHNITNIGEDDLYTIFWISEHFDASDPDTYYENVEIK